MEAALKERLTEAHADELHDIKKYDQLAKDLCAAGCHCKAKVIKDIMADEESHAKYLMELMGWGDK